MCKCLHSMHRSILLFIDSVVFCFYKSIEYDIYKVLESDVLCLKSVDKIFVNLERKQVSCTFIILVIIDIGIIYCFMMAYFQDTYTSS